MTVSRHMNESLLVSTPYLIVCDGLVVHNRYDGLGHGHIDAWGGSS